MSGKDHAVCAFTADEARALFGLIDELSGNNASNVFLWDGTDDPADPTVSACLKLFAACGRRVPDDLKGHQ